MHTQMEITDLLIVMDYQKFKGVPRTLKESNGHQVVHKKPMETNEFKFKWVKRSPKGPLGAQGGPILYKGFPRSTKTPSSS